jgi:hypothetical protein
MNVWDIIKSIDTKSRIIEYEESYNQYIVNFNYARFVDTLLLSQEMNKLWRLPVYMQYEFYYQEVCVRNRWKKWPKDANKDIKHKLAECLSINPRLAESYFELLTEDEVKQLQNMVQEDNI